MKGLSKGIVAMKIVRLGVLLVLSSIVLQGRQTITVGTGKTPVYRIKLRVHNGQSTLPADDLRESLEEMNSIWSSQAGICFEITNTRDDARSVDGFDIWFVPEVPDPP